MSFNLKELDKLHRSQSSRGIHDDCFWDWVNEVGGSWEEISARLRALEAEVKAWREADDTAFSWNTFATHEYGYTSKKEAEDNLRIYQALQELIEATDATGGVT